MFMNNQCLFTVCSRAREHEQLREQLVNIGLNPAGSGSPPRRRGQGSCPVWAAPTAAKGASRRTLRHHAHPRLLLNLLLDSSYGELGALNAESICERILRAAGLVLDDGNTMLADATLEKLTLLRIKRGFMEFMREHYNHLSHQDFKILTVVREADKGDGDTGEAAE